VTYEISRQARREESEHEADIYQRVYGAQRPELFFKSASWRVAGSGQAIAVRSDSAVNVPEPEVAVVVTPGTAPLSGPGRPAQASCTAATTSSSGT